MITRLGISQDTDDIIVQRLGLAPYGPIWDAMRDFTEQRNGDTADEIWLLQHPPVFTLGLTAKREHLLSPGDIPVIATDRGGQVTYHGPGQLILYPLLDLRRRGLGIRQLVTLLEQSVIGLLAELGIDAQARPEAPGVYVNGRKVASLGLRIRRGCSYHGLSLNLDMDLEPFRRINPCGYADLEVAQLRDFGIDASIEHVAQALLDQLVPRLQARQTTSASAAHS
jgi:lipoyl(octanoyl) transferase